MTLIIEIFHFRFDLLRFVSRGCAISFVCFALRRFFYFLLCLCSTHASCESFRLFCFNSIAFKFLCRVLISFLFLFFAFHFDLFPFALYLRCCAADAAAIINIDYRQLSSSSSSVPVPKREETEREREESVSARERERMPTKLLCSALLHSALCLCFALLFLSLHSLSLSLL